MMIDFYIDIENASGQKQGAGPISATNLRVTRRMDGAGSFSFEMAITDPNAAAVQPLRRMRARAHLNGAWVTVGDGIIEQIGRKIDPSGIVMLTVSGGDGVRELAQRTVRTLQLAATGAAISQTAAVAAVAAYAPAGWTFGAEASSPNQVYARFAGESCLQALISIAKKSYSHFRYDGDRVLTFDSTFSPSGVRAVGGVSALAAETCAIVDLEVIEESYDVVTRVHPYGAGQGDVRLNLKPASAFIPTGLLLPSHTYTMNKGDNYIEATSATALYGLISRTVEFKDVGPLSNTNADVEAAALSLRNTAIRWLNQHLAPTKTYRLAVAGCSQVLRPMQSIRVVYRDTVAGINIDETLNILEVSYEVRNDGLHTTGLVVSTGDRFPDDDGQIVASTIEQGVVFQAHPQLNANSYVTSYIKPIDQDATAEFRFRFGAEVVQLQQVAFEFQLLPLESTVKSVGGTSTTTSAGGGATATSSSGGAATATSSAGGGTTATSGSGGGTNVTSDAGSGHTHEINLADSFVGNTVYYAGVGGTGDLRTPGGGKINASSTGSGHTHGISIPSHIHGVTIGNHTHDVTTPNHSHDVTIPDHVHTFTPVINPLYGIYRESGANTFALTDLDYQVNATTPGGLETAVSIGGGWYRLDITALVTNPNNFRPAQENNTLVIRRKTGSTAIKTAMIDGQLTVRNIIQGIAYT